MAGVLGLHTPEDFNRLAKLAVRNCEVARQRLHSGTSGGPLQELRDLDSISNTVCSIVDAAEFARNNHADPAFRDAAEETFAALRQDTQGCACVFECYTYAVPRSAQSADILYIAYFRSGHCTACFLQWVHHRAEH
jgi:hypothetical protein